MTTPTYPFVHLHVHSYFSVLDGQASVNKLISLAVEDGMKGLALTDHGSMFGIKEFADCVDKHNAPIRQQIKELEQQLEAAPESEKDKIQEELNATRDKLFKPILGCECYCARRGRLLKDNPKEDRGGYHLILLAKNLQGYKNLIKIVSLSYTEGFYYKPRIDKELLERYHEGIIVCSACLGGEIPQLIMSNRLEEAKNSILWFKSVFGDDYYLELQRHKTTEAGANGETYLKQEEVNQKLLELSKELGVKVIASNDVHFATADDAEAHDLLVCLNTKADLNSTTRMRYTRQEWLKSRAEMSAIFADIPEALTNTMEILDKVEYYSINNKPLMPDFPLPEGFDNDDDYLKHLSYEGAYKRYGKPLSDEVIERLDFELNTIKSMGFPGYFLIVQDFIQAARDMGVSVGPGRGSAAGSLVAYVLGITNLDPIKYDLLFERFLNPDRISLPDIDIDFDDDGRLEVIKWVAEKYGHEKVAHIVTYGTMASKSAIKDVARVTQVPLSESNILAKLVPERLDGGKVTLKAAIDKIPELSEAYYGKDMRRRKTLDLAMKLEGTVRNTGMHACGIIIGKGPISDTVPIFTIEDNETGEHTRVTQYEGKVIEDTGLIKMDFLGLKTLSIIKETLENIKKRHNITIDIESIPLDDAKTYDLFCKGRTAGVFQFESAGMQKYMVELQPSKFEDLIAMNALYRPGPMAYIPSFINRKHGKEAIEYDLPAMERYLRDTYGITVFQEQVMLLSRELADFTRGESDTLRKAMGKKQKAMMDKLRKKFVEGGNKKGYETAVLEKIWGDWEEFAKYAFNKSHSTCYSWVAYQTAYLKANYPPEFMAGLLSRNLNNITEITKYIDECHKMGIQVLCPDVNESDAKFTVNSQGNIRFGLSAIKGMPRSAVSCIVEARDAGAPFKDVYDFVARVPSVACTRKVLELLVYSGAFDSFKDFTREDYFYVEKENGTTFIDKLVKCGLEFQQSQNQSQSSLFGESTFYEMAKPAVGGTPEPWSDIEKLNHEQEVLGIYLTASPLDKYEIVLKYHCNISVAQLSAPEEFAGKEIIFGGLVIGTRHAKTRGGADCAFIKLQDYNGTGELPLFGNNYLRYINCGKPGLFLLFKAKVERSKDGSRCFITPTSCEMLDDVYDKCVNTLTITVPFEYLGTSFMEDVMENLLEMSKKRTGFMSVDFEVYDPVTKVGVKLESPKLNNLYIRSDFIEDLKNNDNLICVIH